MYLNLLGWHWKHPADLTIERPNGHFGMQLILVQSKARIRMGDQKYCVGPNTAFLVKSCLPHAIYADGEEYVDDWIRFSPEQDDHAFLDSLALTWNVPIPLMDDTVSKMIAACDSIFHSELQHKNRMLHHTMTAILLYLSEFTHPASGKKNFDYSKEFTITDVDRAGDKYTYRAILKMYDSKGNFEESGVPSSEVYI